MDDVCHHLSASTIPAFRYSHGKSSTKSVSADPNESRPVSLKILIAEDDNISRLFISRVLEKAGHIVFLAKDGKEGLNILKEERSFDVILTDIQMPELDGVELTKILRSDQLYRNHAHLPVIAMTAYGMKDDRERYLAAGIDEYLPKPINPKLLTIMLNELTDKIQ
ncbi:response regulator [Desulfosediminicola sp.]|uniref:response regulator n=1 Tax=Desulfosediminicola sp. TaxID=2886825 RepID=UPI003AF2C670